MTLIFVFLICFGASIVGAICGIGGGVIIKPLLDAFHIAEVGTISFLSGCTVLAMTSYSVIKSRVSGASNIEFKTGAPLALGAAVGGIIGKWAFSLLQSMSGNKEKIGAVQAACLMLVTLGTLLYTINKQKIKTHHVKNPVIAAIIGLALGVMSSFLGIGGGPINLVVFYFFFSMSTKSAAENSLYVIFFSQITSLIQTWATGRIPKFSPILLCFMIVGGILGGIFGRNINKKINEKQVDKLFVTLMAVIILINVYNIYRFLYV